MMIKNYAARTARCARGRFTCSRRSTQKGTHSHHALSEISKGPPRISGRELRPQPGSHNKEARSLALHCGVGGSSARLFIVPNQRRTDAKSSYIHSWFTSRAVSLRLASLPCENDCQITLTRNELWAAQLILHLAIDLGFEVKHLSTIDDYATSSTSKHQGCITNQINADRVVYFNKLRNLSR